MLDAGLQNQLRAYFTKLRRPVRLVATLNESETAREMKALLKEVAALSELLSYEETLDPSLSRPSFQITSTEREIGIHFAALPMGHEFSSFVLALLQAGGHPVKAEAETLEAVRSLSGPLRFEVFISLSCHNCPDVVQALNLMAVENPNVSVVTIDGALAQEEAKARRVMAVPTVFLNGEPARGHYRKFHIRQVEGNNDFASLQEALTRRLAHLSGEETDVSFASVPDLIVIDGGKGQLSSVLEAVGEASEKISFISLAKREEEVFTPHKSEPIVLPRDSYALKLLQRIRDEAHRFAITFHRGTRGKRMRRSSLEDIPGVGAVGAKKLLKAFGSIAAIKQATVPELAQVVNRRAAENVYAFYADGE